MPNDSSSGGDLLPAVSPAPVEDDALDDFLGDQIAAITGLSRDSAVLPRYQQEPPNLPAAGTDWVAFGAGDSVRDFSAVIVHTSPNNTGVDTLRRGEVFDLACSFYGPNARKYADLFSDGLQVAQNREPFLLGAMAIVDTGAPKRAPQLIKNVWFNRFDLTVRISRWTTRVYPVLDLASAPVTISDADDGLDLVLDVLAGELDFSNPDQSGLTGV